MSYNTSVSPDGYTNAETLVVDGVNPNAAYTSVSVTSGTLYTFSVFAKANTQSLFRMRGFSAAAGGNINFDLSNGTISGATTDDDIIRSEIQDYGNGWYRCICVFEADGTGSALFGFDRAISSSGNLFDVYGPQIEAGSYATSLISTQGSAVTRLGDDCKTTSLQSASLIGATAGTFFIETTKTDDSVWINQRIFLTSTTTRSLLLDTSAGQIRLRTWDASSVGTTITTSGLTNGPVKYLLKWDGTNVKVFANGSLVGSSAQPSYAYTTYSALESPSYSNNTLKQLLFFPTALTDAECITLTSP